MADELVLTRTENFLTKEDEERVWTLTYGGWNKVQGLSANGYWRDASEPVADFERIESSATLRAACDGVFFFTDRAHFVEFIERYLGGEVLEAVNVA